MGSASADRPSSRNTANSAVSERRFPPAAHRHLLLRDHGVWRQATPWWIFFKELEAQVAGDRQFTGQCLGGPPQAGHGDQDHSRGPAGRNGLAEHGVVGRRTRFHHWSTLFVALSGRADAGQYAEGNPCSLGSVKGPCALQSVCYNADTNS